jgi:hypothetical protein
LKYRRIQNADAKTSYLFSEAQKKYAAIYSDRDCLINYFWGLLISTEAAYCVQIKKFEEGGNLFELAYTKYTEAHSIDNTWTPIMGSWAFTLRLHGGFKQATEQDTKVNYNAIFCDPVRVQNFSSKLL